MADKAKLVGATCEGNSTVIPNPAAFMRESGLLFEVNRTVLHPLGLALYIIEEDDGTIRPTGLGVVATDTGEPFTFDPERAAAAEKRLADYLASRKT